METSLDIRIQKLERRYRQMKQAFTVLMPAFIALLGIAFSRTDTFDIIRAKGIILEDSLGRDRILIGSPVPYSKDRVRLDTALVRKYWASKVIPGNPDEYMGYYRTYRNKSEGIVVMNEQGFDRVLLGDRLADANTGRRMFEAAGILWNDRQGFELGGAGVNTTEEGLARTAFGLDNSEGEAIHMVAMEDGTKGLVITDGNGYLMFGMSPENGALFQNKLPFTGIRYFDGQGVLRWEQDLERK